MKGFRHAALVGALSLAGCASSSAVSETSPGAEEPRPAPNTSERDTPPPSWMSTNSVEDHPIGCMACITCDAPPDDAALCDGCMEYDKKCGGTSYGLENVESGSAAYWKKRSASLLADILLQTSMRREEYLRHEQKKIGLRSGEDLWEYRWRVLQNLKKRARK